MTGELAAGIREALAAAERGEAEDLGTFAHYAGGERALLLERIMDEELPRYAGILKRLGEGTG